MIHKTIAFLVAASCLTMLMAGTAGAALVNSPFITSYDGWSDPYNDSITPLTGGWPGWGILLDHGTLCECSDGTVADGGAANNGLFKPYLMVNSNTTSSTYTLNATLMSSDDDGLGFVFGYVDPDNYFRVSLRNQADTTYGFAQGVSLQRVVGGSITQIGGPDTSFLYPISTPATPAPINVSVAVNGAAYTVTAGTVVLSGSDADLKAGQYGVHAWRNKVSSITANAPWGTELQQVTVDEGSDGSIDRTHAFTGAWPVPFKKITMTRSDGSQNLDRTPLDQGNFRLDFRNGAIIENSDAYAYSVSSGAAQNADFISPAIIVDQPGAENMENMELRTRVTCGDNEGPGVLVRVQQSDTDPNQVSFYRIQFGWSTMGTNRCPKGLSVQKCVANGTGVNPTWTELYRDNQTTPTFLYQDSTLVSGVQTDAVPFDLKVKVTNSADDSTATIRVEVVNDPDGAATPYSWTITDGSNPLLTGTVGLANWGNSSATSGARGFGTVWGGYGGDPTAALVVPEPSILILLGLLAVSSLGVRRRG